MVSPKNVSDTVTLSNGVKLPRLGFGLYLSPPDVSERSCSTALKLGYRHIDSGQYYQNEAEAGDALRKSGLKRSDVFLTTKILAAAGSEEKSYQKLLASVNKMDSEAGYVDLFLIHSPNPGAKVRRELWAALERLYEEGKAKAIGVSNFGRLYIEEMKEYAKIWPPHVNQIELHPWCQQRVAVDYCHENGIVVEAYAPMVRNYKANDEKLVSLSKKYGKSPNQILIRWSLQKGYVPLPKSDDPSRMKENADVYDFEINAEDMKEIDDFDQGEAGSIVEWVKN